MYVWFCFVLKKNSLLIFGHTHNVVCAIVYIDGEEETNRMLYMVKLERQKETWWLIFILHSRHLCTIVICSKKWNKNSIALIYVYDFLDGQFRPRNVWEHLFMYQCLQYSVDRSLTVLMICLWKTLRLRDCGLFPIDAIGHVVQLHCTLAELKVKQKNHTLPHHLNFNI